MDLLHQRYASPFSFLDNLIENSEFSNFIEFMLNKIAEERDEKTLWEFFLHKVYDKSFTEWKESLKSESKKNDVADEATKKEIMERSQSILDGFNPSGAKAVNMD